MKALLVVILGFVLSACGASHHSTQAKNKNSSAEEAKVPNGAATIKADPNPVPPGGELGTTTITWDTGGNESGQVFVAKDDGPEKLFGTGASGSSEVKWIRIHTRYEFRLYEGTQHDKLLGKVQVVHETQKKSSSHS